MVVGDLGDCGRISVGNVRGCGRMWGIVGRCVSGILEIVGGFPGECGAQSS